FLFCSDYGPHRLLRSFPTRRSSDLDSGVLTGDKLVFHEHSFKATVTSDIVDSNTYGGESFRCDSATYIGSAHGCVYDQVIETFTDRKSTRLNSSHVKISYAVFCLKK